MHWEVFTAHNGEQSLRLNGYNIYSKYRPKEDAWKWIENEIDSSKESYLLIGLGLGYHLERLLNIAEGKHIYVYYFNNEEKKIFEQQSESISLQPTIKIVNNIKDINIDNKIQVLIPNVWIKALGKEHVLVPYLEDIKINQVTYKKSAGIMEQNFLSNIKLNDFAPYPKFLGKHAALIASGPSLNETIHWLKGKKHKIDLFVVGSALKMVLANNLKPSAVVISDAKSDISIQLQNVKYDGPLFYLSTANHDTVLLHKGKRYILLQKGYSRAEELSKEINLPLIETGGSVSTTALSLLDILNYEKVYLFGLDLGFHGGHSHASHSTSGRVINRNITLQQIVANSGSYINTTPNLYTYLRWINKKIERIQMEIFNTALNGAKIDSVKYINEHEFHNLIR